MCAEVGRCNRQVVCEGDWLIEREQRRLHQQCAATHGEGEGGPLQLRMALGRIYLQQTGSGAAFCLVYLYSVVCRQQNCVVLRNPCWVGNHAAQELVAVIAGIVLLH